MKCEFLCKKIKHLGHVIDKDGLHMDPDKVKEINELKQPTNMKELQSLLGMVNFYRRFLPETATALGPLYKLLKADEPFVWSEDCSKAWNQMKHILTKNLCLTHFNPNFKTKLTVDGSPIGVGAVLSQIDDEGREKPVEFASRSLSETERKYAQIDREAVAILFGVTKFHQFLFGRKFILVTDNTVHH